MTAITISDFMTTRAETISASSSVQEAAKLLSLLRYLRYTVSSAFAINLSGAGWGLKA
jgi:hypothetical protein